MADQPAVNRKGVGSAPAQGAQRGAGSNPTSSARRRSPPGGRGLPYASGRRVGPRPPPVGDSWGAGRGARAPRRGAARAVGRGGPRGGGGLGPPQYTRRCAGNDFVMANVGSSPTVRCRSDLGRATTAERVPGAKDAV